MQLQAMRSCQVENKQSRVNPGQDGYNTQYGIELQKLKE